MDTDDTAWTVERLRHSLQALAMPAEVQLALFPDFVCKADELALEFDNWYLTVRGHYGDHFTLQQRATLETIDRMLDEMSGQDNAHLWSDEAVRNLPDWVTMRRLAREALTAFGWEATPPPSYAHEYIPFGASDTPNADSP